MVPPTSPRIRRAGPHRALAPINPPVALVILDGFGYSKNTDHNAISAAHMTTFVDLCAHYPHALLDASGDSVGLLPGMIGNSAVGHLTIGAGRVVPQPIKVLLDTIHDGTFASNKELAHCLHSLHKSSNALHIIGLLSDAGIHCHTAIIKACIRIAQEHGIKKIVVHPILDGRDAPPQSAQKYLTELQSWINTPTARIGTLVGRYYAMDRNANWDRTSAAYTMLTQPDFKNRYSSWSQVLETQYAQGITDEFIPPTHLDSDSTIEPGDGIIFCNIRADRARQLTTLLLKTHPAWIITGIPYFTEASKNKHSFSEQEMQTHSLYTPPVLQDTLLDKLVAQGKTIFTCAESEKYAHISYFFKGGKEDVLPHETRVIIPSLNPKTFVTHPEMRAPEITKTVLQSLRTKPCDFYLVNYANPDMVGHSGNFDATVQALRCIDEQLAQLYNEIVLQQKGTLYITADHGKAEQLWDTKNNQPNTAHTANPVPFVMVRQNLRDKALPIPMHTLADIAPLILSTF